MTEFQKETSNRVFSSRHHRSEVEVHTKVFFVVQDQPERRGASGLLGGGSRLHPVFGLSCDFSNLVLPFEACQDCINHIDSVYIVRVEKMTIQPGYEETIVPYGWWEPHLRVPIRRFITGYLAFYAMIMRKENLDRHD